MLQYEGKRVRGPNGEVGVIQNGQLIIMDGPASPPPLQQVIAPQPKEPTPVRPVQEATDQQQLENARLKPSETRFGQIDKLKDNVRQDKRILAYESAVPIFASALTSPDTPEADNLLVNAIAKIGDPATGVQQREGQSYEAAAPTFEQIKARLGKEFGMDDAGNFTPEGRRRMKEAMRNRMQHLATGYNSARSEWRDFIKTSGVEADPDTILGQHFGAGFQQSEADYLNRPVRNLDGSMGAAPSDPVTPIEIEQQIKSMVDAQMPASEILNYVYKVKGKLDEKDAEILRAYDAALQGGHQAHIGVRVDPAESSGMGIVEGALLPIDRAAEGLQNATNYALGTKFSGASEVNRDRESYFRENPTTAGGRFLGNVAGGAAITAPFGPFIGGATANALLGGNTDFEGIAKDAIVGGVGGKLTDWGLRGAANALAPAARPEVQRLANEGIEMTPGQIAGGAVQRWEDRATSLPFTGDAVTTARQRGYEQFNKAIANRALAPIGKKVPPQIKAGHDAVKYVYETLNEGYNKVIPQVNVALDGTFATRFAAIKQRSNLPADRATELDEILQREVGGAFATPQSGVGKLTGREYKMLDERISDLAQGYKASDDPYTRKMGQALDEVGSQLRSMVRRQNPRQANALRALDKGYANYVRLRGAAAKAPTDGIATPGQLRTVVTREDGTVGKGATARGDALMQDLASDASKVLPSKVPNSGTPERGNLTDPVALTLGAATRAGYSEPVQRAVQKVALRRPGRTAQTVANALRRIPAGTAGAAAIQELLFAPQ